MTVEERCSVTDMVIAYSVGKLPKKGVKHLPIEAGTWFMWKCVRLSLHYNVSRESSEATIQKSCTGDASTSYGVGRIQ